MKNCIDSLTVFLATSLPRAMILTISLSVALVLLLAGFVLYMWRKQEERASEIERVTDAVGAGVLTFIIDDGHIMYKSNGFKDFVGFKNEELKEVFDNNFYLLLVDKYVEFFNMINVKKTKSIYEEMQIKTEKGVKWVIVNGSVILWKKKYFAISAVVVDIDVRKKLAEKLAIEQERYRLATELSNDIIMNYSIVDDTLNISENFSQYFGGETTVRGFLSDNSKIYQRIHPDDLPKMMEFVNRIKGDNNSAGMIVGHDMEYYNADMQIRVKNSEGKYIWCRFISVPLRGYENKEFIGKLINIDAEKNSLLKAEKNAMTDPMTKALNKEFTKLKIQEYIDNNSDKKGMLLLVDIDKFKSINDNYGHIMGDNIIIEVVNQVKKAFRSNDIVGRIGGDEFVVFVCNVNNPEDQIKQAKKLHAVLRQPATFDGVTINKSASIGIAIYPDHAATYEGLIECADKALYRVKGSGRDAFIIYDKKDFVE